MPRGKGTYGNTVGRPPESQRRPLPPLRRLRMPSITPVPLPQGGTGVPKGEIRKPGKIRGPKLKRPKPPPRKPGEMYARTKGRRKTRNKV